MQFTTNVCNKGVLSNTGLIFMKLRNRLKQRLGFGRPCYEVRLLDIVCLEYMPRNKVMAPKRFCMN